MATKANTGIAPETMKAAIHSAAQSYIAGKDGWCVFYKSVAEFASAGAYTDKDDNKGKKDNAGDPIKWKDDDAHRIIEAVVSEVIAAKKPGIEIDKTTATTKKSQFRNAIRLGMLAKEKGMNASAILADAEAARGKSNKPVQMFEALNNVAKLQISDAHKAKRLTIDEMLASSGTITKKDNAPNTLGETWAKHGKALLATMSGDDALDEGDETDEHFVYRRTLISAIQNVAGELLDAEELADKQRVIAENAAKRAAERETTGFQILAPKKKTK